MSLRLYHGDRRVVALEACNNRGGTYGDGLFETMRVHTGTMPWWDQHWARFKHGTRRLRITLPNPDLVAAEATELACGVDAGVLRLIANRGPGARGYAPATDAATHWQLSLHPLPETLPRPLSLRWCQTRLSIQPLLAGLKHCNRLEQVLARAEWHDPDAADSDADDGLMRSMDGDVVCATSANLFIYRDGAWVTPPVDRCGVAGVCRERLLAALAAVEVRIVPADIETASAVFLCNAVRGILPVGCLGARVWSPHPALDHARRLLAVLHPAFLEIP